MKNNKYNGNNVGEYPLTISEKVVVPSRRMRLNDVLADIFAALDNVPEVADEQIEAALAEDGAITQAIASAISAALAPMEVSDITAMTDEQLDALEVGDKVAKQTGTAAHLYVVSYKDAENGGICLTYTDASTVETVSYDHLESGWAYNSTDKGSIPPAE